LRRADGGDERRQRNTDSFHLYPQPSARDLRGPSFQNHWAGASADPFPSRRRRICGSESA
jgi:hypothetical protein